MVFVNDINMLTYHKSESFSMLLLAFYSKNKFLSAITWCET